MIGPVLALAALALGFGPNNSLLAVGAAAADELEGRLVPWEFLVEEAGPLWIAAAGPEVRALASGFPGVVYVPREGWAGGAGLASMAAGRVERWLPGLRVPRLVIDGDGFLADPGAPSHGWRLVPLEGLAVDEVDALLRALLQARFARWLDSSATGPTLRQALDRLVYVRRRSEALHPEVPPDQRVGAYLGALEDFGAAALAIRHEIGRHARRRGEAGLCAVLDHPATLFGHWRRTFEEAEFRGSYRRPDADPRDRRAWMFTERALEPEDKVWLLGTVLGVQASGDPCRDFAFFCNESAVPDCRPPETPADP